MSTEAPDVVLNEIKSLTDQMLDSAKSSNWVDVAKFEAKRQEILKSSLSDQNISKTTVIVEAIGEIMKVDQKVQFLLSKARDQARDEIIELNRTKNKAQAYQQP